MTRSIVGIPARMSASRFPGKPLADILGLPMIQHVYERSKLSASADHIIIATCDDEIRRACQDFGADVIMTDPGIERPGLRVAAACQELALEDDDIVVVVQGDEPLVHPDMIDSAISALSSSHCRMGTLVGNATADEWKDPHEVKVVLSQENTVLYMSRSPIPSNERAAQHASLKQVAIMPFRMEMLQAFQSLPMTPLETIESVELLRALEHGVTVLGIHTTHSNVSVDTPEGLAEAAAAMKHDPLFMQYGST